MHKELAYNPVHRCHVHRHLPLLDCYGGMSHQSHVWEKCRGKIAVVVIEGALDSGETVSVGCLSLIAVTRLENISLWSPQHR